MKATKATMLQRDEDVFKIIVLGGEFHDIREYAVKHGWGLSDTQLRRYQTKALELCQARVERDRDKVLARHLMQRRAIYARAMEAGDWRAALAVAKDEAELFGLYPPTKIAPTKP